MNIQRLFLVILTVVLGLSAVSAIPYYKVYQPSFTAEAISDFYVTGGVCANADCTAITSQQITLLDSDQAMICFDNFANNGNEQALVTCLENAEIAGNQVNTGNSGVIVTKEEAPTSFKSITHFFPKGDSYIPYFFRTTEYPTTCTTSQTICIDNNVYGLGFGKIVSAIAEIGQLNIVNLDDPLKPVQVEVPVSIDETVCSAYQYANSFWKPSQIPAGYSDFSALTQLDLTITQISNNNQLYTDSIQIPIEAETCAGLSAFSWTPSSGLENEQVKFEVTTEVIDNQVITSQQDYATVTETVYPTNLDGTCWTRAFDFTLSNQPTFELNTGISQMVQGESLYAGFRGGAWRDNSVTPMNFDALLTFDDGTNPPSIITTYQTTPTQDLTEYFEDISSTASTLPPGNYEVTLITRPNGPNCIISEDTIQTQQLTVLAPEQYTTQVFTLDEDTNAPLANVSVHFVLINPRDDFQVDPVYDQILLTNANGEADFTGMYPGNYSITLSKADYATISQYVEIGSNGQFYFTLSRENSAPLVDLPTEFTMYYQDELFIDVGSYVYDFNDPVNTLTITPTIDTTSITQSYNPNTQQLLLTTGAPTQGTLTVQVQDPSGATASDTAIINFIDNDAPQVLEFTATPDNGDVPLTTTFIVNVQDTENDPLTCSIDFDDGTTAYTGSCTNVQHTYTTFGTYTPVLTVEDGINTVTATTQVFVFEKIIETPHVRQFTFDSTNGLDVPTDITFNWVVEHDNPNTPMSCVLRVNGVNTPVDCTSGTYNYGAYTLPGTASFALIATDGTYQDQMVLTPTFVQPVDMPATIQSFTATPQIGNAPLDVTFNYVVSDDVTPVNQLMCRIDFGDGFFVQDTCDQLDGTQHTYVFANSYLPRLQVTDEVLNVVESVVPITVDQRSNTDPVINSFNATPIMGIVPLDVQFTWDTSDVDNDTLTCSLDFNDGTIATVPCDGTMNHTFTSLGVYNVQLQVQDAFGGIAFGTQTITVTDNTIGGPEIDLWSLSTSSGDYIVPTDVILAYAVSHPLNDVLTCQITGPNNFTTQISNCTTGFVTLTNFTIIGTSAFTLQVTDSIGRIQLDTIIQQFFNSTDVDLTLDMIDLEIQPVIQPGPFSFSIATLNETLIRRELFVEPTIVCDGVTASLSEPLDTFAVSTYQNTGLRFNFNTDTQDFNANIPTDIPCLFKARIIDKFGTDITLTEFVRFAYPSEPTAVSSIRGNGADIMNYMSNTVLRSFSKGYNSVKFTIENNEGFDKQMSISLMSRELGLKVVEEFGVDAYDTQTVQLPVYISKDKKSGKYPVRISFDDGKEKQTRYSYIYL
jgi:PKD repeat protein